MDPYSDADFDWHRGDAVIIHIILTLVLPIRKSGDDVAGHAL